MFPVRLRDIAVFFAGGSFATITFVTAATVNAQLRSRATPVRSVTEQPGNAQIDQCGDQLLAAQRKLDALNSTYNALALTSQAHERWEDRHAGSLASIFTQLASPDQSVTYGFACAKASSSEEKIDISTNYIVQAINQVLAQCPTQ
jgi:hypothetical protein